MTEAYLSLGSNMGDRLKNLTSAVEFLNDPEDGIIVKSVSPVFETDPVGYTEQDAFLNICVKIETVLSPQKLLSACQAIEKKLHRVPQGQEYDQRRGRGTRADPNAERQSSRQKELQAEICSIRLLPGSFAERPG